MTETATTRKTAEHQRTKLTVGLIPRNSVDGDCARVFQRIDWLPTPMQMPNEETGKRRRKARSCHQEEQPPLMAVKHAHESIIIP